MSKLVTPTGEILVPGVKEMIAPVTQDEQEKFEVIHFQMKDIHDAIGGEVTISDNSVKTVRLHHPLITRSDEVVAHGSNAYVNYAVCPCAT